MGVIKAALFFIVKDCTAIGEMLMPKLMEIKAFREYKERADRRVTESTRNASKTE